MPQESLHQLITSFESLAAQTPLEIFVFLGMFIDEIFPPIPSLFMLIVAGAFAKTQGQTVFFLLYLSVIGALGKTLAAWILYVVGDKAEHIIVPRFGKMLGVSHKEVERISKRLNQGWKDLIVLFIARAVPIIPTTPVSIMCGVLKINIKIYLLGSFAGTLVRSALFLYFGYFGLISYEKILGNLGTAETVVNVLLAAGVIIYLCMRARLIPFSVRKKP